MAYRTRHKVRTVVSLSFSISYTSSQPNYDVRWDYSPLDVNYSDTEGEKCDRNRRNHRNTQQLLAECRIQTDMPVFLHRRNKLGQ